MSYLVAGGYFLAGALVGGLAGYALARRGSRSAKEAPSAAGSALRAAPAFPPPGPPGAPAAGGFGGERAPTPRMPGATPTLEMDFEVGEATMAQAFAPDYSAQAVPGLADIYRHIQSGAIRGYLMVVGGPDRGAGLSIQTDPITIGRAPDNTFQLRDAGVSNHQVTIALHQGALYLTDSQSLNGTFVNNQRVSQVELQTCDVIAFGSTKILVSLGS